MTPQDHDSTLRDRYEAEGATAERYGSPSFWDARYHRARFRLICGLLDDLLRPATSFLDVGAGTGEYLRFAVERGIPVSIGVDLSFAYCTRARHEAPGAGSIQASAGSLPFPDRSVDVVLCSEVLEHLPLLVAARAVRELRRVARCAVVVTTPNRAAAVRRLGRALAPGRVDRLDEEVGHINLLADAELRRLLVGDGWSLSVLRGVHILPPVIGEQLNLPGGVATLVCSAERFANSGK